MVAAPLVNNLDAIQAGRKRKSMQEKDGQANEENKRITYSYSHQMQPPDTAAVALRWLQEQSDALA